jgi:hypothetical protein
MSNNLAYVTPRYKKQIGEKDKKTDKGIKIKTKQRNMTKQRRDKCAGRAYTETSYTTKQSQESRSP